MGGGAWPHPGGLARALFRGRGSQLCLACLPADSSGTVSWLPAKMLPLPAGCHPGPDAKGPAGGQQLHRSRAVIPARRLQSRLGVGAFLPPLEAPGERSTAAPAVSTAPKVLSLQNWKEQIRGRHSKGSTSWAEGPWSNVEPPAASVSTSRKWSQFKPCDLSHG